MISIVNYLFESQAWERKTLLNDQRAKPLLVNKMSKRIDYIKNAKPGDMVTVAGRGKNIPSILTDKYINRAKFIDKQGAENPKILTNVLNKGN